CAVFYYYCYYSCYKTQIYNCNSNSSEKTIGIDTNINAKINTAIQNDKRRLITNKQQQHNSNNDKTKQNRNYCRKISSIWNSTTFCCLSFECDLNIIIYLLFIII